MIVTLVAKTRGSRSSPFAGSSPSRSPRCRRRRSRNAAEKGRRQNIDHREATAHAGKADQHVGEGDEAPRHAAFRHDGAEVSTKNGIAGMAMTLPTPSWRACVHHRFERNADPQAPAMAASVPANRLVGTPMKKQKNIVTSKWRHPWALARLLRSVKLRGLQVRRHAEHHALDHEKQEEGRRPTLGIGR